MSVKLIKAGLLFAALAALTGCASTGNYKATNMSKEEAKRVEKGELVRLQSALPENPAEKLVITPATFPNGVYVCAIETLFKPCLPKLSALVADKLGQKGVAIAAEQSKADATLYFEAWFDSYSTHSSAVKSLIANPAETGRNFAAKMEQSLATGSEPDVHKRFRGALDPFSLIAINSNDEQKFIYVALTAVEMKSAEKHVGTSKNPWVGSGVIPPKRTLIGNYDGATSTEKAVTPMLHDAVELLVARVGEAPKKD